MVTGSDLAQTAECVFGLLPRVRASFVSSTLVGCAAPKALAAGTVELVVSNSASEGQEQMLEFEYTSELSIELMEPTTGVDTGGAVVRLVGNIASSGNIVQCKFGQTVLMAMVQSGSLVSCLSPVHTAGNVTVSLSTNGVDFTSAPGYFEYTSNVVITRLCRAQAMKQAGAS